VQTFENLGRLCGQEGRKEGEEEKRGDESSFGGLFNGNRGGKRDAVRENPTGQRPLSTATKKGKSLSDAGDCKTEGRGWGERDYSHLKKKRRFREGFLRPVYFNSLKGGEKGREALNLRGVSASSALSADPFPLNPRREAIKKNHGGKVYLCGGAGLIIT